jgi:hypothetical protein
LLLQSRLGWVYQQAQDVRVAVFTLAVNLNPGNDLDTQFPACVLRFGDAISSVVISQSQRFHARLRG